jgi:small-conductance mechanosensitive channel
LPAKFKIIMRNIRGPLQLFLLGLAFYIIFKTLKPQWANHSNFAQIYSILAIVCLGWLLIKVIYLGSILLLNRYDLQREDDYRARQVHTQIRVLQRIAVVFVVFLSVSGILFTFESVRSQGIRLLASAGILSILIGLAAQKTMSTFFAGLQIAIAQPIRVDDVVVVENEWGRIEEIHLTYVIVKLWDLRRLIVPITYFTDRVFQNWTQKTADILGTVMLYVDYSCPVKLIRQELDRFLEGNRLWDGKVKGVQVTNTTEHTMEIRILVSSPDSGTSFDLRCAVREHMISYLQKHHPVSLPRLRAEISNEVKGLQGQKDPV